MKTKILLVSFVLTLVACEKLYIEDIESKTAVVEGYLFAGQSIDSLKVTQSFSYNQVDSNIITLDNLDIKISDFTNEYSVISIGNGIYQNLEMTIEYGKSYHLEFVWEGEIISAETYIPLKKEASISQDVVELPKVELGFGGGGFLGGTLEPVEISWDNSEGDYYYTVVSNIEDNPEFVNENIAANFIENNNQPRFNIITEPQISDFYALDARRQLMHYGTYQIIIFRVNPEYATLYENSSNSSLSLEEPPTNVENGLGIFTGVSSDTLYLEVRKI